MDSGFRILVAVLTLLLCYASTLEAQMTSRFYESAHEITSACGSTKSVKSMDKNCTTFINSQCQSKRSMVEVDNPRETLQVLGNLAQRILEAESFPSNEKRGLDLGLSRGFSGSEAAKHLMGMAAASFANGPGRKRRFVDEQE